MTHSESPKGDRKKERSNMNLAIETIGLSKSYGAVRALEASRAYGRAPFGISGVDGTGESRSGTPSAGDCPSGRNGPRHRVAGSRGICETEGGKAFDGQSPAPGVG